MGVEDKHPSLTPDRLAEWELMRASAEGESAVKAKSEVYLPKPSGFKAMQDKGVEAYRAYKMRANFPELVTPSISAMIGIAHAKEVQIELPGGMEYLWESATSDGLTLEAFHRRITRELLTVGRYGVLTDAPEGGGEPYLTGYLAETIINWDKDFWVLDETAWVRDGFKWSKRPRYRVLSMETGAYGQSVWEGMPLAETLVEPAALGGKPLDRIPFAVGSAVDISTDIMTPPLIGVARPAIAIYQLAADYRWQLYMSGQETLVAINGAAPTYVGAGVSHSMTGTEGQAVDLKYVSPSCSGIEAHKVAIEEQRKAAVTAGAKLFDQTERSQESGEARGMRYASETATLYSVVLVSCGILERALRNVAMMKGLDENTVVVTPPTDLMESTMPPADAVAMVSLWQNGAISYETLHDNLQKGGIVSADRDAEAELALIDKAMIEQPQGQDEAI